MESFKNQCKQIDTSYHSERISNEELVQLDTILNKINYYGLNIIKSKIHSDHIKELMDYDLIKFEREVYKPSMPLMGKWFDNTQDFNSLIYLSKEVIENE